MVELDDKEAADLERVQDEVHSRLARRYGLSKSDIAKMAYKKYGGNDMTEKTDEVLADFRNRFNSGGKKDVMERMMEWEMIKGLKRDNETQRPPPPQYSPEGYGPQQPMRQQPMQMQEMMMMMMIPAMAKSMGGGEDDLMKIYKMKLLMSDGEEGKGLKLEQIERMMAEERAAADARMEQLMNTVVGRQEAEKLRLEEARWRKEIEQKAQNAEYLARNPAQPQQAPQSPLEKMDEGMDMMSHVKSRMENVGMVTRPDSPEDKTFELDKMNIGHKQGIESKAVDSLASSVEKLANTGDHTLNKVIDLVAKEQEVKTQQVKMGTPEGQAQLQAQYEQLGNQVIQETEMQEGQQPITKGDVEFSAEDDLDATE